VSYTKFQPYTYLGVAQRRTKTPVPKADMPTAVEVASIHQTGLCRKGHFDAHDYTYPPTIIALHTITLFVQSLHGGLSSVNTSHSRP
jgi:hypothetical protein